MVRGIDGLQKAKWVSKGAVMLIRHRFWKECGCRNISLRTILKYPCHPSGEMSEEKLSRSRLR
jgi:hypothetical protein